MRTATTGSLLRQSPQGLARWKSPRARKAANIPVRTTRGVTRVSLQSMPIGHVHARTRAMAWRDLTMMESSSELKVWGTRESAVHANPPRVDGTTTICQKIVLTKLLFLCICCLCSLYYFVQQIGCLDKACEALCSTHRTKAAI